MVRSQRPAASIDQCESQLRRREASRWSSYVYCLLDHLGRGLVGSRRQRDLLSRYGQDPEYSGRVILSTRSRLNAPRAIQGNLTRFITWLRTNIAALDLGPNRTRKRNAASCFCRMKGAKSAW